jgi:hypothetical protein
MSMTESSQPSGKFCLLHPLVTETREVGAAFAQQQLHYQPMSEFEATGISRMLMAEFAALISALT